MRINNTYQGSWKKSITKMKNYSKMIYRWSTIIHIGSMMRVTIYYRSMEWKENLKHG